MATQKIDLGNVVGPKGATGAQGNGFYRANTKLNTGSTSVSRSLILPTGKALLLRDTIVDNNGLVFEVTEAAAASASTVKISYKTSLRQTYNEVSENIKSNFLALEKDLYTEIPANADLNDYTAKGNYGCLLGANVPSIQNKPIGLTNAFKLVVEEIAATDQLIQKITENYSANMYYRTYSGGNWGKWFNRGVMSVFSTFSQLGITSLPCTTLDVYKAMPANSIAILGTDTTAGITDLPGATGTLEITKASSSYRYKITFYKSSGGDVPAIKGMWLATTNTDHSQLTWKKFYSEEDVVNNGTTTVAGKIVDARYAKTLTDKINTLNSKTTKVEYTTLATKNGIEVGYAKEGDKWDFYVVGNLTTELTTSGFELCNFPSGFMVGRASAYPVGSVYNACVMLDAGTGKIKLQATTGTVGKDLYINSCFMALSCNRRV